MIGYRDSGILSTRPTRKPPAKSDDSDGPQSSVAPTSTPKELMEKAKRMAPAGQGQVAYNHLAVNPKTGHRIASADGKQLVRRTDRTTGGVGLSYAQGPSISEADSSTGIRNQNLPDFLKPSNAKTKTVAAPPLEEGSGHVIADVDPAQAHDNSGTLS